MTTFASDNKFPLIRILEDPDPPDLPPAGELHLKVDEATKKLYTVNDAGTELVLGEHHGDAILKAAVDAKGDLIAGTAADTVARLPIGTNGHILYADSGETTGIKWAAPAAAGIADQGAFTYLDATEASAPSTPASGKVRVYAKSDGRIYSKDDGGIEYGPFSSGGAALDGLRLSGVRDDPASIPTGTHGDEFEYASRTALLAVWTKANGSSGTMPDADIIPGGSHVWMDNAGIGGRGIVKTGLSLPADFEVAALFSNLGTNMCGIGISNGTAGTIASNYAGGGYMMNIDSTYTYSGTGASGGSPPSVGYVWLALRRSSGNWRYRYSTDGTTWTTAVASSASPTVSSASRIFVGQAYSGRQWPCVHRVVYGTPDLGL